MKAALTTILACVLLTLVAAPGRTQSTTADPGCALDERVMREAREITAGITQQTFAERWQLWDRPNEATYRGCKYIHLVLQPAFTFDAPDLHQPSVLEITPSLSLTYPPRSFDAALSDQVTDPGCALNLAALHDAEKIKVGMLRREVEKDWTLDGGLMPINQSRYCYRKCESIKFLVDYKLFQPKNALPESPYDKVKKISAPFLETPFTD